MVHVAGRQRRAGRPRCRRAAGRRHPLGAEPAHDLAARQRHRDLGADGDAQFPVRGAQPAGVGVAAGRAPTAVPVVEAPQHRAQQGVAVGAGGIGQGQRGRRRTRSGSGAGGSSSARWLTLSPMPTTRPTAGPDTRLGQHAGALAVADDAAGPRVGGPRVAGARIAGARIAVRVRGRTGRAGRWATSGRRRRSATRPTASARPTPASSGSQPSRRGATPVGPQQDADRDAGAGRRSQRRPSRPRPAVWLSATRTRPSGAPARAASATSALVEPVSATTRTSVHSPPGRTRARRRAGSRSGGRLRSVYGEPGMPHHAPPRHGSSPLPGPTTAGQPRRPVGLRVRPSAVSLHAWPPAIWLSRHGLGQQRAAPDERLGRPRPPGRSPAGRHRSSRGQSGRRRRGSGCTSRPRAPTNALASSAIPPAMRPAPKRVMPSMDTSG